MKVKISGLMLVATGVAGLIQGLALGQPNAVPSGSLGVSTNTTGLPVLNLGSKPPVPPEEDPASNAPPVLTNGPGVMTNEPPIITNIPLPILNRLVVTNAPGRPPVVTPEPVVEENKPLPVKIVPVVVTKEPPLVTNEPAAVTNSPPVVPKKPAAQPPMSTEPVVVRKVPVLPETNVPVPVPIKPVTVKEPPAVVTNAWPMATNVPGPVRSGPAGLTRTNPLLWVETNKDGERVYPEYKPEKKSWWRRIF